MPLEAFASPPSRLVEGRGSATSLTGIRLVESGRNMATHLCYWLHGRTLLYSCSFLPQVPSSRCRNHWWEDIETPERIVGLLPQFCSFLSETCTAWSLGELIESQRVM